MEVGQNKESRTGTAMYPPPPSPPFEVHEFRSSLTVCLPTVPVTVTISNDCLTYGESRREIPLSDILEVVAIDALFEIKLCLRTDSLSEQLVRTVSFGASKGGGSNRGEVRFRCSSRADFQSWLSKIKQHREGLDLESDDSPPAQAHDLEAIESTAHSITIPRIAVSDIHLHSLPEMPEETYRDLGHDPAYSIS